VARAVKITIEERQVKWSTCPICKDQAGSKGVLNKIYFCPNCGNYEMPDLTKRAFEKYIFPDAVRVALQKYTNENNGALINERTLFEINKDHNKWVANYEAGAPKDPSRK
jgi:hypothetical protein